jgi:3-mercaptopyruvate sulfurtransferase SseA
VNNGFKKVRPLHGGLDAWIAAGYAVATIATEPANAQSGAGAA